MQLKTKVGLALIALGLGIFSAWDWWTKTRIFVPVNAPVTLSAGDGITSQFKLNFDGLYLIEIEAEKSLPLDTLRCLMGLEQDLSRCNGVTPVIAANWRLSSRGRVLRSGTSAAQYTAPPGSRAVTRVIGEFQGKAGQEYTLQATFTADGSKLAPAYPRVKVAVSSIAYTDLQSAGVLTFSAASMCILFGVILLGIAAYAKRSRPAV